VRDLDGMCEIALGMSNFDHSIDSGLDAALRASPGVALAEHSAWNFCGYVWFEDGQFHEQVWRYKQPVAEYSAETLTELMEVVNDEHGSE
jgi:hypothetical protein